MLISERRFRPPALAAVALASWIVLLTLAGCGQTAMPSADFTPRPTPGGFAHEVDMGATDFVQHRLTIRAGDTVTFVVRMDGGPHILCLGQNGQCDSKLRGPVDLEGIGFRIDADQTKVITFTTPGTYHITCPIYPTMNLTITVNPR